MGTSALERLKDMYDGFERGDFNPFLSLVHERVRWHLPGASAYAGTTQTRDELVTRLLQQSQATAGTVRVAWVDGAAQGDLAVVFERVAAAAGGSSLDVGAAVVYRFEDGVVVEAWDVFDDQAAYDAFWEAASATR